MFPKTPKISARGYKSAGNSPSLSPLLVLNTRKRKTNNTVSISQTFTAHEAVGVEADSTDAGKFSCVNDSVIIDITTVNDNPKQPKVCPDTKSDKKTMFL